MGDGGSGGTADDPVLVEPPALLDAALETFWPTSLLAEDTSQRGVDSSQKHMRPTNSDGQREGWYSRWAGSCDQLEGTVGVRIGTVGGKGGRGGGWGIVRAVLCVVEGPASITPCMNHTGGEQFRRF